MVSIKMVSKFYSAKLCAGAQQWPRLGSWGAPLTSTLEIRNLEKKPQNVEDKPLWPVPWRFEPWKINPGTKEKQSKPRKQAQTAKRQAPLTSSLENQTNKSGKQNIKHGQKSQNLENNLSNLEYKDLDSWGRSHEPGTKVLKSKKAWKLGKT